MSVKKDSRSSNSKKVYNMEPTIMNTGPMCETCHQPVLPIYYFCPNCGTKLNAAPLSTSLNTQLGLYAFSIILPMIAFLFVTRWKGVQYIKSKDPKAQQIGYIAAVLLFVSTVAVIWLSYVWTEHAIDSTLQGINTDFEGL